METNISHANEMALALRSRDPLASATVTSSLYVHRDLRNINNMQMSLPDLCEKIPEVAALGRLKVIASECYVSNTTVRHRYLIVELRHGKITIWMRLDRRRSLTSILSFLSASSRDPANDTVAISLTKEKLIDQGSRQENRQQCGVDRTLTLEDMSHFLSLMVRELTHYRLFDANCWLFTGAIQSYLQQQENAQLVSGRFPKSNWALKTRYRIMTASEKLYNVSRAPLVFKDLNERLEACMRHPAFEKSDQKWLIPKLRGGIEALEGEHATGQKCTTDANVLSRELRQALEWITIAGPPVIAASLIEIGLFLVRSSSSMSLALPWALAAKAQRRYYFSCSDLEYRALWRDLIATLKERRQNIAFVQQHREFCDAERLYETSYITGTEDDTRVFLQDLRSVYILGIDAEAHILDKSPRGCVSALVDELGHFARYLTNIDRHEEACSVWARAVQTAQNCRCDSECSYKRGYYHAKLSNLLASYAESLSTISEIDRSLEQYKAALSALPEGDPLQCFSYFEKYSNALVKAGRIEESYNVLHEYIEREKTKIQEAPTRYNAYYLADAAKDLCSHPHIYDDHDQQLLMLSDILCWLRTEDTNHCWDNFRAAIEREAIWDYANTLATLGRYEASEKAFAELVGVWRMAYEAEWKDDNRPVMVEEWYFAALDMYAKILDFNGKVSNSGTARELSRSLQIQHSLSADICASQIGCPRWEIHYDEDDPQHPPWLVYEWKDSGKARPAASLPVEKTIQSSPVAPTSIS